MNLKLKKEKMMTQFELSKITLKNLSKFELSPTGKLVLLSLVNCHNPEKAEVFPRQKTIADELGISERSVVRAIKEITNCQIVICEVKKSNRYKFTSKFFELVKLSLPECQIVTSQSDKLSPPYREQKSEEKNNNNNKILNFQMTEFQRKYADVFEKLSEYDVMKYKTLQGYEKEKWLLNKRKELFQQVENKQLQLKIDSEKQKGCTPLDFSKEQAIEWLENLPALLQNSFYAKELRRLWNL